MQCVVQQSHLPALAAHLSAANPCPPPLPRPAPLPPVSLVNLVMSLGIGVEFCAHLVHAFVEERGTSEDRAAAALGDVGAAVLSGITLTKIAGGGVGGCARVATTILAGWAVVLGAMLRSAGRHAERCPVLPPYGKASCAPLLPGVAVLAFSRTRIFEIYYFRMASRRTAL